MKAPRLSIHMPVHNAQSYLEPAIRSVLNQSYRDFELITINDGSTDDSGTILDRLAREDDRLRVIHRGNRGVAVTRNEALGLARGVYFGVMDADDFSRRDRFQKQIEYLDAHPECVAVGSRILAIDSAGAPICEMCFETTHEEIDGGHLAGRPLTICHPASVMRKSAVEQVGGYDPTSNAEDFDLFLKLGEVGQLQNLPEVLFEYRQHTQSYGYARRVAQRQSALAALKAAHARRQLPLPNENYFDIDVARPDEVHRKWAWWALAGGHVATARKHAFRALCRRPFALENWRAAACAIRGY
jgi:glycosyltransferase involved in cell wall biosynthesis